MPAQPAPSSNEKAFLISALRQNIRLDNRPLSAYRPISLDFPSTDYGTTDVRIGKTRILARISAQVVKPYPDRKFEGVFTINAEIGPLAGGGYEVGRPDTQDLLLSRLLEKTIRRSNALDTETLCLIAGQKCFHIRADLHILAHDGNLVDASCLALVAALLHFRRPDIEIRGEEVVVFSSAEREGVPLTMLHWPFCVSTSYYDNGAIMLNDATRLEEQCREGEMVLGMNRFGEVVQIGKLGGEPVEGLALLNVVMAALEKVKFFDALVKRRLAEDAKVRDKEGLMAELSAENER